MTFSARKIKRLREINDMIVSYRETISTLLKEKFCLELEQYREIYNCSCVKLNQDIDIFDCHQQDSCNRKGLTLGLVSKSLSAIKDCACCRGTGQAQ